MTTHRLAHTKWAEPSAYRVDRVDTGEWLRSRYIENSERTLRLQENIGAACLLLCLMTALYFIAQFARAL